MPTAVAQQAPRIRSEGRLPGRLWLALAALGLAAVALTLSLVLTSSHETSKAASSAIFLLLVGTPIASGLIALANRPENRTGALLVAVGLSWVVAAFSEANHSWLYTLGNLLGALPLAVFIHLLLAFPTGRVQRTWERTLVASAYAAALLANLTSLLFDVKPENHCENCPANALLIVDSNAVTKVLQTFWDLVGVGFMVAAAVVLARRWHVATRAGRRVLTPVYVGGLASVLLIGLGFALEPLSSSANGLSLVGIITFGSVPLFFLAGLLRTRLARTGAAQLLQETPDAPSVEEAQTGLRRALNDPTLRLFLWLDEAGGYLGADGTTFEPPEDSADAAVTRLAYEGRPLAALVHDPALRNEPELLADVLAAARTALVKDRSIDALRSSERRNRALLDAIPDTMFRIRRDGTYLDFHTHELNEVLAVPESIIGANVRDYMPPNVADDLLVIFARVLDGGGIETYENELVHEGEVSYFEARVVKGGEDEVLTIVRDITDRKQAEQEMMRQRDYLRTVLNTAASIFCVVTPEGRIVRFNDPCAALTGYPSDDRAHGGLFWELFAAPGDAEAVREAFEADVAGAEYEHRWATKAGERLLIAWSSTPLTDAEGEPRRLIHGVDITGLRRQEDELRHQYEFLRTIGRATPSLLAVLDADGRVGPRGVSDSFARVLGHDDDAAIGRPLWELVSPGDDERVRQALAEADGGGPVVERESVWVTADGEPLSVSWSIRALGELAGRPSYLVCGVDVTEQKRQQEELRRSRARIVEAEAAERRRLERNLHDGAQQRLVSLSLSLRLAQAKLASDPQDVSEILGGATDELAVALEELRELARGIHPAVLTDRGLAAALEALSGRAPFPVELTAVPDERLPEQVEATAFYVVSESLTNVAKYAQASAARVSVTRENGHAVVEVADDGVGGADSSRGTGLRGLVDRVEALDGRLVVESPRGEGTRVRAVIPL